tara:strand:- start:164 stop:568 length:405 start_codon:yes stop_codon:yes gene_type:complete
MTQIMIEQEQPEFTTPLSQRISCKKWYNNNREAVLAQRRASWREKNKYNQFFALVKLIGINKRESQNIIKLALSTGDLMIDLNDEGCNIPYQRFYNIFIMNTDYSVIEVDYKCDGNTLTLQFHDNHIFRKQKVL